MTEVEHAIRGASAWKAPRVDGLPAVVWQRLWPVVQDAVFRLFEYSLRTGKQPRAFKIAKIVPLRKPNRGNYERAGRIDPSRCCPPWAKRSKLWWRNGSRTWQRRTICCRTTTSGHAKDARLPG